MTSVRAKMMTVAEVAKALNTSRRSVRRWALEGMLPGVRIGRGYRFERDAVRQARTKGLVMSPSGMGSESTPVAA